MLVIRPSVLSDSSPGKRKKKDDRPHSQSVRGKNPFGYQKGGERGISFLRTLGRHNQVSVRPSTIRAR